MSQLSGAVLAMQGFQGTICSVKEDTYFVNKINGIQSEDVIAADEALKRLEVVLEKLIRSLTWRDFELLIDLIFRQAGWRRVSESGGTMKSLDLDLVSPVTSERYGVQVKSKAGRALFESYRVERLKDMQGFKRFYFAVHSPSADLTNAPDGHTGEVELLLPASIARLAVQYGLANWVIDKAR